MDWGSPAEAKITEFLELLRSSGFQFDYVLRRPGEAETGTSAAGEGLRGPRLSVELSGPDAALMIQRGGELLHAVESMTASILRLEPEEHDELSFDALGFKQQRQEATRQLALGAVETVRATSKPYVFPPMNSRERRMLHLLLAEFGHPTASSGDGARRFVVLYPVGQTPTPERFTPRPVTSRAFSGRGRDRQFGKGGGNRAATGGRPAPSPPQPAPAVRLDPNGNPLEPAEQAAALPISEEERLASLRRAFRKR